MYYYDRTKEIVDFYGADNQFLIAMQECGELIQAISKYMMKSSWSDEERSEARQNIISEMADVAIMNMQLRHILNIDDELIKEINYKIKRQLKRMESEKHEESKDSDKKESKTESGLSDKLFEEFCNSRRL